MNATVEDDSLPLSPQHSVNSETLVRAEVCELLRPRIRCALRSSFAFTASFWGMQSLTELTFNAGKAARVIHQCEPDLAFFDINVQIGHAENRVPGDIEPSYKWNSAMENALGSPYLQNEFKQVLSQVNLYMKQHGTRYGFIFTNQELESEWEVQGVQDGPGSSYSWNVSLKLDSTWNAVRHSRIEVEMCIMFGKRSCLLWS